MKPKNFKVELFKTESKKGTNELTFIIPVENGKQNAPVQNGNVIVSTAINFILTHSENISDFTPGNRYVITITDTLSEVDSE
jgi:hypothetical protein